MRPTMDVIGQRRKLRVLHESPKNLQRCPFGTACDNEFGYFLADHFECQLSDLKTRMVWGFQSIANLWILLRKFWRVSTSNVDCEIDNDIEYRRIWSMYEGSVARARSSAGVSRQLASDLWLTAANWRCYSILHGFPVSLFTPTHSFSAVLFVMLLFSMQIRQPTRKTHFSNLQECSPSLPTLFKSFQNDCRPNAIVYFCLERPSIAYHLSPISG